MRCALGYEEQVRVSQTSDCVEHRESQASVVKRRAIGGDEREQAAGDLGNRCRNTLRGRLTPVAVAACT